MASLRKFITIVESAQLAERYTSNNTQLLKYMKDGKFDPYSCWHIVAEWIAENGYLDDLAEAAGEEILDADELGEHDPELFYRLPEDAQKDCAEHCVTWLLRHDPAEAPSHAHMDLARQKLLPRTTWLVHFSDAAKEIAHEGFQIGVDEMDKLGLTTYLGDYYKGGQGYNFAFRAQSRDALFAARKGKYGRDAVLFQNSGVVVDHHGDEEEQVIFHGTDVGPKEIVYLKSEGGDWQVIAKGGARKDSAVYTGEFEQAVAWVIKHYAQYRKVLAGA